MDGEAGEMKQIETQLEQCKAAILEAGRCLLTSGDISVEEKTD